MNNCMKVTDTLILCLKCIHEEMWGKNIIKAIANVMFSKKIKLEHRISLSLVYVHCLNLLKYFLCLLLS